MLKASRICLRDMKAGDLADYERWLTVETEWQDWDAPWEEWTPTEVEQYLQWRRDLLKRPLQPIRSRFEICTLSGTHIGWVTCYPMDGDNSRPAVGIDIPSPRYRCMGYGREAFALFTEYIARSYPQLEIYCQTWSGNLPMMALAESVGFELCRRQQNARTVRGQRYDALTYRYRRDQ